MPSKRSTLVLDALMLSGPLLVVVGARVFLAPAPSAAESSAPAVTPAVIMPVGAPGPLSSDQQRAAKWIADLGPLTGLVSPMDHPEPPPPPPIDPKTPDPVDPPPLPPEDPAAGLRFTGLLGNEDIGLAMINGKIYRVGDEVRPGVKLTNIDARHYIVVLTLPDGSERTLRRRPQP